MPPGCTIWFSPTMSISWRWKAAVGGRRPSWSVLDQLEDLIPEDDRAGGGRHVLANGERSAVDHRRQAVVVHHVTGPVGQPAADAAATGVVAALDRRGIGSEEVGRRHGLPEQDHPEARPLDGHALQVEVVEIALHPGSPGEVALPSRPEQRVLLPGRVGEALVTLLRRDLRPAQADLDQLLAEIGHRPQDRLAQEAQGSARLAQANDIERAELLGGGPAGLRLGRCPGRCLGRAPGRWDLVPFWMVLVGGVAPRVVVMTASQ